MRLVILLLLAFAVPAHAQVGRVTAVEILERGIYQAEVEGVGSDGVQRVRQPRLLQDTTRIPARLGLGFGVRYAVRGGPPLTLLPIEIVTRFPAPGLKRPDGLVLEHRHTKQLIIGATHYSDFRFDEREELVPGRWVIQFWYLGRKVGEQAFCVFVEPSECENANA